MSPQRLSAGNLCICQEAHHLRASHTGHTRDMMPSCLGHTQQAHSPCPRSDLQGTCKHCHLSKFALDCQKVLWAMLDSNQRPHPFQGALYQLNYQPIFVHTCDDCENSFVILRLFRDLRLRYAHKLQWPSLSIQILSGSQQRLLRQALMEMSACLHVSDRDKTRPRASAFVTLLILRSNASVESHSTASPPSSDP